MSLIIENAQEPKKRPLWVAVGIVLLAVVTVVAVSFYVQNLIEKRAVTTTTKQQTSAGVPPQGLLFFSVFTKSPTTQQMSGMVSGVFDTSNGKPYDLRAQQVGGHTAFTQQFSFSPDKQWVTFLAAPYTATSGSQTVTVEEGWGVYRARVNGTSDRDTFVQMVASSTQVAQTDTDDFFHEFPSVTQDGVVAYSALSEKDLTAVQGNYSNASASLWSVYVVRPYGTKVKVAQGLRPKWISSTLVAYLKDDGVYQYDFTKQKESLLLKSDKPLTVADGFDVSNDGSKLVLTEPSLSIVVIGLLQELESAPGVQKPIVINSIAASNPVFSSDGSFIALLTHGSNDTAENPRLQITYLNTSRGIPSVDISRIDASTVGGIYLTDWR